MTGSINSTMQFVVLASVVCLLITIQPSTAQVPTKAPREGTTTNTTQRLPASDERQSKEPVGRSNRVKIDYVKPRNGLDIPLFERLEANKVLEKLQAFFSPLRLPRPLTLRLQGCKGQANAYYENDTVTVCVEAVYDMVRAAQNRTKPAGLDQKTIVLGGFFHVFLHEVSHAVFDYFGTPILGREEDAADQLAAYIVLNLEKQDARQLVTAAIYLFADEAGVLNARQMNRRVIKTPMRDFSGFHSTPAQRLYNILCMAYGADKRAYAIAVTSGALPRDRAAGCADEYIQVQNAYRRLIVPHIDLKLGRLIRQQRWLSLDQP